MADCTDAERKLLDNIKDADVMIVFRDEDQSSIVFMRGYDEHPPAKWSVDYGWLGEDGKSGEKIIRKFACSIGLTAKQFAEAAARGRRTDAEEASRAA